MAIEVGNKSRLIPRAPVERPRAAPVERPPAAPAGPAPTARTAGSSSAGQNAGQSAGHVVDSSDLAKIAVSVERAPVKQGAGANPRSLLVEQTRARTELGGEQRKLLKLAYKELAASTSLPDHLAMRALAAELGVTTAFDEIMRAHRDRLLPQLLEGAHVFAGASALLAMQTAASAMDARAPFDEAIRAELALALGWAKNDGERSDVETLAARLGISLATASEGPSRAYEASPKHHGNAVQGGFVSPAPTNGQRTLDVSVQVKPESPRRVGVDAEAREYVVFDETVPGTFHGHTRTWDQLHPDMQRALVAAGQCTNNGRIA